MSRPPLGTVLRHIHRLAGAPAARHLIDLHLLRRFAEEREENAFAELMQRHGPLVLRVCRRILGHEQDAEDAFQATFLVLARKARSIRKGESVGSFLYGVAYRIAMKERSKRMQRRRREQQAEQPMPTRPQYEAAFRELQVLLDEGLNRLPEKYRTPFVLCCLQGMSKSEAARELGWKEGTVSSRLAHARKELQQFLSRKGVALAAVLMAAGIADNAANASVPPLLAASALRTALRYASSSSAAAETAKAVQLAETALRSMATLPWKTATVLLMVVCLAVGSTGLAHRAETNQQAPPSEPPKVTPNAARKEEKIRTDRYGDPLPEGALARLGTVRFRQGVSTSVVAFFPDGKMIACAAGAGRGVCLWDAATGKLVRQIGPRTHANALAISPDGKVLACAFPTPGRAEIALYEAATGRKITDLARDVVLWQNGLVYAPDGKTIACESSSSGAVHFYDAATGKKRKMEAPAGKDVIHRLAWCPDGKKLAWLAQNGFIHLWDVDKGEEIGRWKGHNNNENIYQGDCVAFAPDGTMLATGGRDQTIRLWDVATHQERHRLDGKHESIHAVIFSRNGRILASGHRDGTIALWDAAKGEEIRRWQAHNFWVTSLDFSPDGKTLVSGAAWECGPRFWDVATGAEVRPFAGHTAAVERILFSQNGQHLLSLGRDKNVLDWNLTTGRDTLRFQAVSRALDYYTFSPRGNLAASWGYDDATVRLWDVATGKECATLGKYKNSNQESGFAAPLAFSPNSRLLAVGTKEGEVLVWDVASAPPRRRQMERFPVPSPIFCVAFSPDGKKIAAGLTRGFVTIGLGDAASGQSLASYTNTNQMVHRIVFSPDSKMLASATWRAKDPPQLWEVATGQLIQTLASGPRLDGFYDLDFSPDGKWLAGTGADIDQKVHVWEVLTGMEVRTFRVDIATGLSVAFSPDGRTIASGGSDSSILLWDFTGRMKDGRLQTTKWTPRELEQRWIDLGSTAGPQAVQAIWDLVASPEQALPLLRQRIKTVEPANAKRVKQLMGDLDSEDFDTRDKATEELEKIVDGAEPELRKKLVEKPSLEMQQRIKQVLSRLDPTADVERLRTLRAIQILEYTGTTAARDHLRELAKGLHEARLTREAKAALERLMSHRQKN